MRIIGLSIWMISGCCFGQEQLTNFGSFYIHPSAEIAVFGNLQNDSTFNSSGGNLSFAGSTQQAITGTHDLTLFNLTLTNSGAGILTANSDLIITNQLTLTDGVAATNNNGLLVLNDNATATGVSNASYIDGPVKKIGNDAFVFPVGASGAYRPISISAPLISTDAFKASYINQNPQTDIGVAIEPSINHISSCEYWMLERTNGTSTADVTLSWNTNSCGVSLPADLVIARWDTTVWVNHGNGGFTGNTGSGDLVTLSQVNSFGNFALASISIDNVLPIELVSFSAERIEGTVELTWDVASELNCDYYEIEKTTDGVNFVFVGTVDATGNSDVLNSYKMNDMFPYRTETYYRLVQTDNSGNREYSDLRRVAPLVSEQLSGYPNPGNGEYVYVTSMSEVSAEQLYVIDNCGKIVYACTNPKMSNGVYEIVFQQPISSGLYTIQLISAGTTNTVRMVVN